MTRAHLDVPLLNKEYFVSYSDPAKALRVWREYRPDIGRRDCLDEALGVAGMARSSLSLDASLNLLIESSVPNNSRAHYKPESLDFEESGDWDSEGAFAMAGAYENNVSI